MGKDRLPGSPQQEGSQARGASPHVAAKRCRDPSGLERAKRDTRPSAGCLLPTPQLLLLSKLRVRSLSLPLCLLSLCFLCARKAQFRVARPAGGGGEGGVGERWLLTPFSPRDRHLWLSCYLSLHTLAGIPEAAMWVAGCVWLCASTCALSSPSCLWRVLPLFLTDCWMRK